MAHVKLKTVEGVEVEVEVQVLIDKMNKIDEETHNKTLEGYYKSRYNIVMGMWKKGKEIAAYYTRVNYAPNYRELKRVTNRSNMSLKKWHELYKEFPDPEEWKRECKKRAQKWADRSLSKILKSGTEDMPISAKKDKEEMSEEERAQYIIDTVKELDEKAKEIKSDVSSTTYDKKLGKRLGEEFWSTVKELKEDVEGILKYSPKGTTKKKPSKKAPTKRRRIVLDEPKKKK